MDPARRLYTLKINDQGLSAYLVRSGHLQSRLQCCVWCFCIDGCLKSFPNRLWTLCVSALQFTVVALSYRHSCVICLCSISQHTCSPYNTLSNILSMSVFPLVACGCLDSCHLITQPPKAHSAVSRAKCLPPPGASGAPRCLLNNHNPLCPHALLANSACI